MSDARKQIMEHDGLQAEINFLVHLICGLSQVNQGKHRKTMAWDPFMMNSEVYFEWLTVTLRVRRGILWVIDRSGLLSMA